MSEQDKEQPEQANSMDDEESKVTKIGSRKKGVSDMFRVAYRVHVELSAIADNKSNIMISINGIIISIILTTISPRIDADPWLLLPTTLVLITCVAALIYSILAALPRVSNENVTLDDVRSNRSNILYFGNFHKLSRTDFVTGVEELSRDSERIYDTMSRDLYGLGLVLDKKFRLLRSAYITFMIGIALSVGSYILVYYWVS